MAPSTRDPYTGLYPEAVYAMWHDPMSYDHMTMGPPYLPTKPKTARIASMPDLTNVGGLFKATLGMFGETPKAELGVLLAWLKAGVEIHQASHWQSLGDTFYGDHLLFDRLYSDSVGFVDQVAERAVGSGSMELVNPVVQTSGVGVIVTFFRGSDSVFVPGEAVAIGLAFEKALLQVLTAVRGLLETKGELSNGTDNLLQGIADRHEEFVYLLQQRNTNTYQR